jgi:HAE1 family hydrophobic/amphiphilic exporter-1
VLEAGPLRLRPILMTSLSIMLGMVPTAIAVGASGSFRAPMAIAVIGGVFSSTLLSLVVVPVVYSILDDATNLIKRLFQRRPKTARLKETGDVLDQKVENKPEKKTTKRHWWSGNY